jgi:hypothetical protein
VVRFGFLTLFAGIVILVASLEVGVARGVITY